jgi:hypothetical protein
MDNIDLLCSCPGPSDLSIDLVRSSPLVVLFLGVSGGVGTFPFCLLCEHTFFRFVFDTNLRSSSPQG